MRYAVVLLTSLIVASASSGKEAAIENARDLANYCQELERGIKGAGQHIRIPSTKEALLCWGYMRAMQNISVLADESGQRIMGSCPPERTTLLQLIHAFVSYARSHPNELQDNTAVVVIRALHETFPCPSD